LRCFPHVAQKGDIVPGATGVFERWCWSPGSDLSGRALRAVAYTHPNILTITAEQVLSLYAFNSSAATLNSSEFEAQPKDIHLLTTLKSHTSWPPLSLSIRPSPTGIIASIAYAIPTYTTGWSVGLQELHLNRNGEIILSRLASGIPSGFQSLLSPNSSSSVSPSSSPTRPPLRHVPTMPPRILNNRPTSLSYAHPYLLAGNRDNTLTLYLVTSSSSHLEISKGTTLWGHTSGVTNAQVAGRGKAVSLSSVGGIGTEIRVWELEGGVSNRMDASVKVIGTGDKHREIGTSSSGTRRWMGFNDEVVVMVKGGIDGGLREKERLVVYDFT
jgi:hypothetical protein